MSHKKARQGGVYAIRNNLDGKVYVGSAWDFEKRWQEHRLALRKGVHHSQILQRAWNKYGSDSFGWIVLAIVEDRRDLFTAEQKEIDRFKAADKRHGYNICPRAGTIVGRERSEETQRRMSEAQRARGPRTPFTKETRDKMRRSAQARKGTASPETRAKISAALRARAPRSRESIDRQSLSSRGRPKPPHIGLMVSHRNRERGAHRALVDYLIANGLSSPNQKVLPDQIPNVVSLYGSGVQIKVIAKEYGVNYSTIYRIVKGITHQKKPAPT